MLAKQGGKAISNEISEVILDARSAKASLAHGGANDAKKVAFAAVKDVIKRGALVYRATTGNVDSYYFSAPVSISGRNNIVTVLVRRDHNTQRMYLHGVLLKENLLNPRVSSVDAKKASERSGSTHSGDNSNIANEVKQGKANSAEVARELHRLLSLDIQANPGIRFSHPAPFADPFGNAGGIDGFLSIMNAPVQGVSEQLKQEAVARVRATVEAIRATWGNAPDVEVVFDMHDTKIPQKARDADLRQRSRGATGDPEGFYFEGKVYLLASPLPQAGDVARVLIHESVGHYGSHGAFGDALLPILNQIATMRPREVADKEVAYGLYDRSKLQGADPKQVSPAQILETMSPRQRLEAAEEVLATMAQDSPELGFVRRAVASIRTWLRNHVPMMDALAMTDEEIINSFILPARAFVKRGHTNNDGAGQLQFNRADNAAHDNDSDPGQADDSADTRLAIDDLQRGLEESYQSESVIQGWTSRGILGVTPIANAFGTTVIGYKVRPEKAVFDVKGLATSNGLRYLGKTFLNVRAANTTCLERSPSVMLEPSWPDVPSAQNCGNSYSP